MNLHTLTVGIALHNSLVFIEETLASVTSQSEPPDELIILDDCSTDESENVARSMLKNYAACTVRFETCHFGDTNATYNAIASMSRSSHTLILDHDDRLDRHAVSEVRRFLRQFSEPAVVVLGIDSNHPLLRLIGRLQRQILCPVKIPRFLPVLGTIATRSGVVYPTSDLCQNRFPVPHQPGSDVIHLDIIRQHREMWLLPYSFVNYRVHSAAQSSSSERLAGPLIYPPGVLYQIDAKIRRLVRRIWNVTT